MTVLGKTTRGYIVSIEKEEFAKLAGFGSTYVHDFPHGDVESGANIPVGRVYEDARVALETHAHATEAAQKLRQASERFLQFFAV